MHKAYPFAVFVVKAPGHKAGKVVGQFFCVLWLNEFWLLLRQISSKDPAKFWLLALPLVAGDKDFHPGGCNAVYGSLFSYRNDFYRDSVAKATNLVGAKVWLVPYAKSVFCGDIHFWDDFSALKKAACVRRSK